MAVPRTVDEHLAVLERGLQPRVGEPKRVLVIGAGMAGLVAASELLRAGHDPVVIEAQQRVGGRVLTLREPFAHGLWAEAGAMRIPRSHRLTHALIDRYRLTTAPFTMDNPEAYCFFGGHRVRHTELGADPTALGFDVGEHEHLPPGQLWARELEPFTTRLRDEGDDAWVGITAEYDQYCIREFLELRGWSEGAIEMFGLLFNQEALMNSSFLEMLREEVGNFYTDLDYIDGGTDLLPKAFLPELADRIRFGAKMVALEQSDRDVTVHYRTAAGRFSMTGDYAILTTPFPVLRHVEVLTPFSRKKQRAIRQLHYDASAKVFLQFRRRFWEDDDGISGGGTVTDLAVRNVYYPDHGRDTGRGVVLASYTWGEDAQRWGSLSPEDRIVQALEDVTRIHPQAAEEFEVGASKMWHDDEFAGGAFALFDPGQQTLLYDAIIGPEGRVHFAGEHASLEHAWIQGAIESGVRAAAEIHDR
ncbi:MAG: flavin monoamine oxidase family protein [Acidimicrobiia bacterium]|nr:flavin monoamine oxidase family protein [Acidimicrobiia bacterium]